MIRKESIDFSPLLEHKCLSNCNTLNFKKVDDLDFLNYSRHKIFVIFCQWISILEEVLKKQKSSERIHPFWTPFWLQKLSFHRLKLSIFDQTVEFLAWLHRPQNSTLDIMFPDVKGACTRLIRILSNSDKQNNIPNIEKKHTNIGTSFSFLTVDQLIRNKFH